MIQIPTIRPVSWPTPPTNAVTAVAAVRTVQPLSTEQDGSTTGAPATSGTARREERPGLRSSEAQPAAEQRSEPAGKTVSNDFQTRREAQEAARQAEAEQAQDREALEKLREVLTSVWQASAAVVDQALGQEADPRTADTSPDLSAVAASQIPRRGLPGARPSQPGAEPLPWPPMGEDDPATDAGASAAGTADAPITGYDERGQGSGPVTEAGRLISQRV